MKAADGLLGPSDFMILTPYAAQAAMHAEVQDRRVALHRANDTLFGGYPPDELEKLLTSTIQTSQGSERRIVIMDAVATGSQGCLGEVPLMYTAVSRSMSCFPMVVDWTQLRLQDSRISSSILGQMVDYAQRKNAIATRAAKSVL